MANIDIIKYFGTKLYKQATFTNGSAFNIPYYTDNTQQTFMDLDNSKLTKWIYQRKTISSEDKCILYNIGLQKLLNYTISKSLKKSDISQYININKYK